MAEDEKEIYAESLFCDSGAHSLYNIFVLKHFARKGQTGRDLAKPPVKWSQGDFSYFDLRKGTPFRKYCDSYAGFMKWIRKKDPTVLVANVDAISNPDLTWEIQRFFEEEHGVSPVPIVHFGTPMEYVDRYIKYDLLGVGGLGQGVSRHEYFKWGDEFFSHICPKSNKRLPLIKTHGFAMTSWELMCRWPWYCMTDEHEVLTRRGWKGRNSVFVGEDVLVYDKDGTSRWSPVLEVPEFDVVDEQIYHLSNRTFDAFVTGNHRWPVTNRNGDFDWKTTEEILPPKDFRIPRRARHVSFPKKKKFKDEVVELLAWMWTDGCHNKNQPGCDTIGIYQSIKVNPDKVKEIRDLLDRTGDVWCESEIRADPGMVLFEVRGALTKEVLAIAPFEKRIPLSFVLDLTEDQIHLFIKTTLKGDGTENVRLVREKGFEICQKNGKNLDVFRIAAILAGYSTSQYDSAEYAPGDKLITVRSSSVACVYSAHTKVEKIRHTGKVWCIRVETGAFFTRCRDHVYVTGNSVDSATWVKLSAYGGLYMPRWSEGWRYDRPPLLVYFSSRSPRKEEKQKHYDNVLPSVKRTADRWLEFLGLEMGTVDKEGEMVEFGVSSHHRARSIANLRYLKGLEASRPEWPYPLDVGTVEKHAVDYGKGFGL